MRLDWIKERAGQNVFRLLFLPGLINPADFFTKLLPVYRRIAALPFLHGTPYHPQPPHPFASTPHPPYPTITHVSVAAMQSTTGTALH
jgi:hypothetical protein